MSSYPGMLHKFIVFYSKIVDFVLGMKNDPEKLAFYRQNARRAALDFTPENAKQYVNRYE